MGRENIFLLKAKLGGPAVPGPYARDADARWTELEPYSKKQAITTGSALGQTSFSHSDTT